MPKWYTIKSQGDKKATISILSEIGGFGVTAQHFKDSLDQLDGVDEITISIDSVGGDVTTGFAIYNMLNRHPAHKVGRVEGLAASMASVILMAADEVEMPENAMLMIHNPWGSVQGEADTMQSFADALRVMQENIATAYQKRTGLKAKQIADMMNKETWLSAKEAVKLGFADRVEKPQKMAAKHDLSKFTKVPDKFGKANAAASGNGVSTEEESDMTMTAEEKQKAEKEIRDALLAKHKEIRSLCAIAGKPDLAEGYIGEDKSTEEVIADLAKRAEDDAKAAAAANGKGKGKPGPGAAAGEVSARHSVEGESDESGVINTSDIYANWNKSRTA
jgi:ATP-dependent Clp protease protease subunit